MTWPDEALRAIREVHKTLPENMPLEDRVKAIDAAYPFGQRANHPYKVWLKERAKYLARYGYVKKGKTIMGLLSPLDRAKAKFEASMK